MHYNLKQGLNFIYDANWIWGLKANSDGVSTNLHAWLQKCVPTDGLSPYSTTESAWGNTQIYVYISFWPSATSACMPNTFSALLPVG